MSDAVAKRRYNPSRFSFAEEMRVIVGAWYGLLAPDTDFFCSKPVVSEMSPRNCRVGAVGFRNCRHGHVDATGSPPTTSHVLRRRRFGRDPTELSGRTCRVGHVASFRSVSTPEMSPLLGPEMSPLLGPFQLLKCRLFSVRFNS